MKHKQKLKQALQELDALKEKVEGLMKPDKFAELKEAHKNGAVIQVKIQAGWHDEYDPNWDSRYEYRIKTVSQLDQDIQALRNKYPQYRFTIHVEDNI